MLGNAKHDLTDENLRRGVIWEYVGTRGAYKCPADRSTVKGRPQLPRFRSYSLNEFLNHYVLNGGRDNHFVSPASTPNESQSEAAANIFAFVCANESTIEDGEFGFARDPNDANVFGWWRLPGERHAKGANLSFLDGHVEYHRWLFTPKIIRIGPTAPIPYFPINDADRQDLRWIVERTPYWYWSGRKEPRLAP